MKMKSLIMFVVALFVIKSVNAQEIYVDVNSGSDNNIGNANEPFKTLEKAIDYVNKLTGKGSITIKLMPGLYVLNDKLSINPVRPLSGPDRYIVEAQTMPDDSTWTPEKMPVIQSVSDNNSFTPMPHSVGFLVSTNNVTIRGIKFLGNSNPTVARYYPITRADASLQSLEVSQCYFIAEKHSTSIQGGIWAHGAEINIDHCIFYNCRNGVLLMGGVKNCSITHSIIWGAYQSAIWVGTEDPNFVFANNIISKCNFFWIKLDFNKLKYNFSDCVITENKHYTGYNKQRKLHESNEKYIENNVIKSGKIYLVEKNDETLPYNYLHPKLGTLGYDLNAGISKKKINQ